MVDRRSFLLLFGLIFSPGCIGQTDSEEQSNANEEGPSTNLPATGSRNNITQEGKIRPDSEPRNIPESQPCKTDSAMRLNSPYNDVVWGNADSLALRVSDLSVEFGDQVTVSFTNTSDGRISTGTKYQYNVETYTEEGWRDVRVSRGGTPQAYDSIEITHEPGEGFVWEFTIREDDLAGVPVHDSSIETCPDLEPGRYRFVYWGGPGSAAPAVAFDVSRPR